MLLRLPRTVKPGRRSLPQHRPVARFRSGEEPHNAAKKALKEIKDELKSFYLTMGDYDTVAIFEAPDDAVAARS
jgi:uncharacterized protein with GYD domain